MRSHFNSGPNYKLQMLPTQFHFYCRFPCWFLLVCLLVEYAIRQTSHRLRTILKCSFVLYFSGVDPMTSPYWAREERERDSGFVCVLHYGAYAGLQWRGWGPAHIGEEPNLSWVRAEEPKKTLVLQNKTLSMEMDIFTCMAPRRTTAEWLFNGKQGHCVRPARESSWETNPI